MAIKQQEKMSVHFKKQTQIQNKAQVRALIFDEALTQVPEEYFDFNNIFLIENVCNIVTFRIEITWHIIGNVTSLDIDFHLFYLFTFSSKALFHHIDDATGLNGKALYISQNVYNSEGVFSLVNIYATQFV